MSASSTESRRRNTAVSPARNTVHVVESQPSAVNLGLRHHSRSRKITFEGSGRGKTKQAKYDYVSENFPSPDAMIQWVSGQDDWQSFVPKLIVSVVHGGETVTRFASQKTEEYLTNGLIYLATRTGAWITTPGYREGIYRMIGEGVKEIQDGSSTGNDIVLLGINAAKSVKGLPDSTEGHSGTLAYPINDCSTGDRSLDQNHSHFLFVDGVDENEAHKRRYRYEKVLQDKYEQRCKLVRLLVNGDSESLDSCLESLKDGVPLVIMAGSGGAADVLVNALKNQDGNQLISLDNEIEQMKAEEIRSQGKHLITVFDPNDNELSGDTLDVAILYAAFRNQNMSLDHYKLQLQLASDLNKAHYARTAVHKLGKDKECLYDALFSALVDDKNELVELLLDSSQVNLQHFVSRERLSDLYDKSAMRDEPFSRFVKNVTDDRTCFGLHGVCCIDGCRGEFKDDHLIAVGRTIKSLLFTTYPNIYMYQSAGGVNLEDDPSQHIYIWAIIFNRMKFAKLFWELSQDQIAGAVVGCALLKSLSGFNAHQEDVDVTFAYAQSAMRLEVMANSVLEICWMKNRQITSDLLITEIPNWGNITILSMAHKANMEEFMSQPACYAKLNKIWRGDISLSTHYMRIVLVSICPLLAFLLKFVRKDAQQPRLDEAYLFKYGDESIETSAAIQPVINVSLCGKGPDEISYLKAIWKSFNVPFVKCAHYTMYYMAYLAAFSLFLMTELKDAWKQESSNSTNQTDMSCNETAIPPYCINELCCKLMCFTGLGCLEVITYYCVITNFLGCIREIRYMESMSTCRNIIDWCKDFWNALECFGYILIACAIPIRLLVQGPNFEYATWLYCYCLCVSYARFTQLFFVFERLGPKIIMIGKMMLDLLLFIVILAMMILAFGTLSVAILEPRTSLNSDILKKVIRRPYFQIYGEMGIEDFQSGERWLLLALYMLLANVLLINLLIAMFSYTFDQIQDKAETLWRFHLYSIVYDHCYAPRFQFIPLIIVHIFLGRRFCKTRRADKKFRQEYEEDKHRELTNLVRRCTDIYLSKEEKEQEEEVSYRIAKTVKKTRSQQLEKMDGSIRRIESKLAKVLELSERQSKEISRLKSDRFTPEFRI